MEYISPTQQEQYDRVLNQIDEHHLREAELRKQIAAVEKKITACHAVANRKLHKKIALASVKIFDDLAEMYLLYSEEIQADVVESLRYEVNKVFYVIELVISRLFLEHTLTEKFLVNVKIQSELRCVYNSVYLRRHGLQSRPYFIVIPVEDTVDPTWVHVSLLWPGRTFWPTIYLDPIAIDVSYHFKETRRNSLFQSRMAGIFKHKPREFEHIYQMQCQWNYEQFCEQFLRHSYHCLDFSKKVHSRATKDTIEFQIGSVGKCCIYFDHAKKILKLESSTEILFLLKNYFFHNVNGKLLTNRISADNVMNCHQQLRAGNLAGDDLRSIYIRLRK